MVSWMSDYRDQIKKEAKAFYEAAVAEFEQDESEFGGRSDAPNLAKWIDRTEKLSTRVQGISAKWGHKDHVVPKGKVGRRSKTRGMVTHAVPAPRASDFGNHLAEYAEFGYALNQMLDDDDYWKFPTQILVGYATTTADYSEIADHANRYGWPSRSGKKWTKDMSRDCARNARRELASRIAEPDRIAC